MCRCLKSHELRSLERNLQAVVSHVVEVLGPELRTTGRAVYTINRRASFWPLRWAFDHSSDHLFCSSLEKIKLY